MIDFDEIGHEADPEPDVEARNMIPESTRGEPGTDREAVSDRSDATLSATETRSLKKLCDQLAAERELALALAGEHLVPGAAAQLMCLWKEKLRSRPVGDTGVEITSDEGRPLATAVKEWLKLPEYRHFRTAQTRGGVSRKSEFASGEPVTESERASASRTLNELVIEQWRARSQAIRKERTWPRYD